MKRVSWLLIVLFILSVVLPGVGFADNTAQAQDSLRVAKITATQGDVKILRAGGEKPFPAFKGMGLTQGDTIVTGKDGKTTLEIDVDKEMRIAENTRIMISELVQSMQDNADKTSFNLKAGKVYCSIKKKLTPGSKYEIRTPTAVMGVRGTFFFVGQQEGRTDVAVLDGTVVATTYLPPLQYGGQPPPPPQPLPQHILHANQQITIEQPGDTPGQPPIQQITQQSLDLLVLEAIRENPEGINPSLLQNIDQVIQQRQLEQQQRQQQQQEEEEDDQPNIQYNNGTQGPVENRDNDSRPRPKRVRIDSLTAESLSVDQTISRPISVTPADAELDYTVSPTSGVIDVTWDEETDNTLKIRGVSPGTAEVTVNGTKAGYTTATRTFTVTVSSNENQVAKVENLRWDGSALYWDSVDNASKYKIKLYQDGELMYLGEKQYLEVDPGEECIDLSDYLTEEGSYTATVTALGDGITYADADESVESEPYIVGSGSAPPAVEDVVIYNFVSGDDEITVSGVLPNERIRIYDAPSGGCLLGEECGYSEDDIVSFSIDSGFDPEMTAIYVTSTCLEPESPESERIEVQIPAPSILQEGSYHDFEVDSVAYGYGRISFMVTTSQVNAIKEALGLTEDDSVTLRGFVGKEEFSDINELPTINDPNFDVVEIEPNTPTAISKLATNNSCFPYAFAVYDEEDNVLLSYVSESDTMIVYSPFDSISPSSVAGNVEFSQEITLTLESTMATRFAAGDLSSKISLDGVFEYLTVESVTRNSDTQIVIGISGNLSSAGRGIINIAASAFTEEPNPDPVSGPIPLSACINVNLP